MYRWSLYVDRAAGPMRSKARAILEGLDDLVISYALWFNFPVSNNKVENEALIKRCS